MLPSVPSGVHCTVVFKVSACPFSSTVSIIRPSLLISSRSCADQSTDNYNFVSTTALTISTPALHPLILTMDATRTSSTHIGDASAGLTVMSSDSSLSGVASPVSRIPTNVADSGENSSVT